MMLNNCKKGFTLIELLVVISIIGLLSSLVLASLTSARNRAIMTGIITSTNQLKNAFELYRTDKGSYPGENSTAYYCNGGINGCSDDTISFLTSQLVTGKYIPTITDNSVTYDGTGIKNTYFTRGLAQTFPGYIITCGKNALSSYIFMFYNDKTLNFPTAGYYDPYGVYHDGNALFLLNSPNWYCIGA